MDMAIFRLYVLLQMSSKCGKNRKVANEKRSSESPMFLPHFYVLSEPITEKIL